MLLFLLSFLSFVFLSDFFLLFAILFVAGTSIVFNVFHESIFICKFSMSSNALDEDDFSMTLLVWSVFPTVPANPSPFTNILYKGDIDF